MFQRGTGERFKYKQAVKEKFPKAVAVGDRWGRYAIFTGALLQLNRLSSHYKRAEDAWADAWIKHVK